MAQRKYDQKLKDDVIQAVIIGDRSAAQVARGEGFCPFKKGES